MPTHLCLSITFLDPRFHGRRDGGEPEWPPSPLRLFQAIVAAAAAPTGRIENDLASAFRWFERLPPPCIVAPVGRTGEPYRLSVPNNAMDLVVKAWSKGNYDGSGDANPATHRTMKTVRPTHLLGGDQIRYLWTLPDPMSNADRAHAESIRTAVRAIVALGWGVDLVVGHGELASIEQDNQPPGAPSERWEPCARRSVVPLRTPKPGTLDALSRRHRAFQNRVTDEGFIPAPPLTTFSIVGYRRDTDLVPRLSAAFAITHLQTGKPRPFNPLRDTAIVAGRVRHALAQAAERAGWSTEDINQIIHGHTPDGSKPAQSNSNQPRFSYVPLPTLHRYRRDDGALVERLGDIRRVLIVGNDAPGVEALLTQVGQILSGRDLIDRFTGKPTATLVGLPRGDTATALYKSASSTWTTVTPMILPGYDDPTHIRRTLKRSAEAGKLSAEEQRLLLNELSQGIDRLIRKALRHAEISDHLIKHAQIEWRKTGFLSGADHADRYVPPAQLKAFSRYHVRIHWRDARGSPVSVPGPFVIGGGRFCGFGVCLPCAGGPHDGGRA